MPELETPLPSTPQCIDSDAAALRAADRLADDFRREAALRDLERRLPHPELKRFVDSGLWSITVPRRFGGAEVSAATLAEVTARISAADGSLGQIPQNHFYALEILRLNGSEEQQRRFFAEALAGERFGNALAELGTQHSSTRTVRLTPCEGGYLISGRKFYATGSLFARWIPTSAIGPDEKVQLAIVDANAPGLERIDDWSGFGQRTTGSGSVVFDRVFVPNTAVVPMQAAFERPTALGAFAQLIHTAVDVGIARGALSDTQQFVRSHARPWIDSGAPSAAKDPLLLRELGELSIDLEAAEAMLERAARIVDVARREPTERSVAQASIAVAEAKVLATDIALAAGSKLFELSGSRAALTELGLDRHWRNARTHTLHDPVRWKYHAIGDYVLNDRLPPRHGAL
ncbi:SfnB family sulfur acquisition oxidoreductase [Halotalea alkalilenta]|uniref:SfnB family sulfur acquisition oxidoreductase n=1 Tax=Halotalea alkalilenta TaxID=376489 RepID=A0A172YDD7_9GAMM|nr:SfnB family sulfur acquisition oxidoreductase [Halotalea alkalilenta]ANF57280.1 SfnB family sulfur acquisition oxidoreductase [Halotalea alkalilenta]